ncbi:cysteine--tRNA ligase [Marivirga tractuosa]|uniref:Cysteine--tRNA ligase n=1 Tax=Marivirga tractuosa (strain ATCC 23168 / DSM 4126 / NBRC 15989 / NCIMB 1408 / VKM B-1430 / H-43) TaxID=643867 RepID=E4TN10_MARTH|nr:cysteine--tRNA ligase [Marivirga tractuosa]ADR22424.1 cysteinyl-tRNA synthetase [Marivirga tractuosa DSM 4126]BDD16905.1 cysteine--tRNA ligase [Marivirga tractuosa]
MDKELKIQNSLTRQKEIFKPINPPFVGMYVCGPTVYSDAHMGNVRTFMSFDVINRYLRHLGYKVRYVRNITDVGHLVDDADDGEDKIGKKAKLENVEPMEIVQRYANGFHRVMDLFNILEPDIEPTATGHIVEQIEINKKLLENGWAYEKNGSIYFDVSKYNEAHEYGILSGRKIEDLQSNTRTLDGQDDKKNPLDFALWKKASDEHIMRWPSPWSDGFPGWHLECTVMSTKYLGETFDIHGGGMDLKFPHHECEIAQAVGANGKTPVNYWIHTNMLTVNGQKMSKSLGNSFLPTQLVSGNHDMLEQGYTPMTVRFFMMQTHYSSTLDFSNEALKAAQKGYRRLANGLKIIKSLVFKNDDGRKNEKAISQIEQACEGCYKSMNDDFNTAKTIAQLFELLKKINSLHTGQLKFGEIGQDAFENLSNTYQTFMVEILGLKEETPTEVDPIIDALLEFYKKAKAEKNYDQVDEIRTILKSNKLIIKDLKTGVDWGYEE